MVPGRQGKNVTRTPRNKRGEPHALDAMRLLDNSLDIIFRYRFMPNRGFEYLSSAVTRITGYTPEEVYANPDLRLSVVFPEDRPLLDEVRRSPASHHEPITLRWIRKDGAVIWVEWRVTPGYDQAGNLVALEGVARDITDRKRSEDAAHAAAAQLERILSNVSDIAYEVTAPGDPMAGQVVFVSRSVGDVLGHRPEEFVQDPSLWFQLLHPDDVPFVADSTRTMYQRRQPCTRSYRLRQRSTGEWRSIEDRVVPRLDDAGRVVGYFGTARDVTDRIRSEEQLRFQSDILRNVRDSVIVTDVEGRITYWNEGASAIFGYRAEEMIGETPSVLYSDQDLATLAEALRRIPEGADYVGECLGRRKDGSSVWVNIKLTALRGPDGRPSGFIGISEDITARRQVQAELRQSEDQYRDLVEHSQDLICIHDLDGRLLSINPGAARVLGYEPAELLGMSVREVLAPEVRHQFDQYIAAIRTEGAAQGLMLMQTRSGERRIWEYRNTLRTEGVAAPVVRGMACDVTERTRAEQALRASEERYRILFETSKDAVYVSARSGQLLDVNEAAVELWGGPREEMMRLNTDDLYTDASGRARLRAEIESHGAVRNFEFGFRRRDGSMRDCLLAASVRRDMDGTIIGYQGIVHDITARKKAESAIRASRDRLRALAAELRTVREEERTVIAREIHDEFGQVLTGLKMDLTWLHDRCGSGPAEAQERLSAMLALVDGSIDAVRRVAARLRPAVLDELGLAAALEWLAADFASRAGIECRCDVPAEEPKLSPERVTAVFRIAQEALTNVARHAGATRVSIRCTIGEREVQLEVRDDGRGIAPNEVASIRSIGLIGMRERANALGGHVYVQPGAERGTVVTVQMPSAAPAAP
jgi:two-component system sensor histidine kinase UhpB